MGKNRPAGFCNRFHSSPVCASHANAVAAVHPFSFCWEKQMNVGCGDKRRPHVVYMNTRANVYGALAAILFSG